MSGGAGFSGEGAKGVSMMQHGHLILLQLEAMNQCNAASALHGSSNGSVVHNCQAQGTLKLVQYVWIVGILSCIWSCAEKPVCMAGAIPCKSELHYCGLDSLHVVVLDDISEYYHIHMYMQHIKL